MSQIYGSRTLRPRRGLGTLAGISLNVFADADYAINTRNVRSVFGGAIMCGGECVLVF